jgi:hypothetical protein
VLHYEHITFGMRNLIFNIFDLEDPLWMEVESEVQRSFGVVFLYFWLMMVLFLQFMLSCKEL